MKKFNIVDSFDSLTELPRENSKFFRIDRLKEQGIADTETLPFTIKILLEALLRSENGQDITKDTIIKLARYNPKATKDIQVPFKPARVLLQDFTGVPCVVDLAAMRSAMKRLGGDPEIINPEIPVDLVIDHSLQIDFHEHPDASGKNTRLEFDRNRERYEFLRWGQKAFKNFRVIPPSRGICHQINVEYLASVVQKRRINNMDICFPDSVVGTDSHTTMINGLGVAGWGVGGIEAEAVMLGQPLYMLAPPVIGFKLTGRLSSGITATDLVLTLTKILREKGVVGKIVEFYGEGLTNLSVPDRTTVSNMAPEYGATMGFFPVDDLTIDFLRKTGRSDSRADLVEKYCKAQGLFRTPDTKEPGFEDTMVLDLSTVKSCLAGHSRPQDRISLEDMQPDFKKTLTAPRRDQGLGIRESETNNSVGVQLNNGISAELKNGSIVIASITSCTNTSNPSVMLCAGLMAKKAAAKGLKARPWVKTSLAPGSTVVTEYLKKTGLMTSLEKIGFHMIGYGCATCIGNSGPLHSQIEKAVLEKNIIAAGVVSGNRNFEGRIHPCVKASYLASPPLVVAYALAGTVDIDLKNSPLGFDKEGKPVYLKDIWPADREISDLMKEALNPELYHQEYSEIESSNEDWNRIPVENSVIYPWKENSSYIQEPSFLSAMESAASGIRSITDARVLLKLGDSITTDHISPAGTIPQDGPAAKYLADKQVGPEDFNSFGSRRGNHHVMTRGTFANIRLQNQLAPGTEGGWTRFFPSGKIETVYDASVRYRNAGIPLIVIAGKDYGMGSSRDWAAKGTFLLGIKAVIAVSFERIHRSNLIGMGVLPLQFKNGENPEKLNLKGDEAYTLVPEPDMIPGMDISVKVTKEDQKKCFTAKCRLDTPVEIEYYKNGGILQTVLLSFLNKQ